MQSWATRLGRLGDVVTFDYPYALAGRRRPDRLPVLLEAHRAALHEASTRHPGPVVLAGKSMGSRIGCHLALEEPPRALICFGYPLVGASGAVRDEVLLALSTPVLFVQGTRDHLCPLDRLESVRARMKAETSLHLVEGGDHSLHPTKTRLRELGLTQDELDSRIEAVVADFVRAHAG
jgi:predicted alpha/beta-hydrolase family hydrolase